METIAATSPLARALDLSKLPNERDEIIAALHDRAREARLDATLRSARPHRTAIARSIRSVAVDLATAAWWLKEVRPTHIVSGAISSVDPARLVGTVGAFVREVAKSTGSHVPHAYGYGLRANGQQHAHILLRSHHPDLDRYLDAAWFSLRGVCNDFDVRSFDWKFAHEGTLYVADHPYNSEPGIACPRTAPCSRRVCRHNVNRPTGMTNANRHREPSGLAGAA